MKNQKIILDLCGGTGAWSKPWEEAGYEVINITSPKYDVRANKIDGELICFPGFYGANAVTIRKKDIYGILAAPPCTMFSLARTNAKKPRDLKEGMECVRACLDIIWSCLEVKQDTRLKKLPLKFWALENPYSGMLKNFLGKHAFIFDPWEFGDGYQKKTAIWGDFKEPKKAPVPMTDKVKKNLKGNRVMMLTKFDYLKSKDIHPEAFGKLTRQERRSITPAGFAKAFFKANS